MLKPLTYVALALSLSVGIAQAACVIGDKSIGGVKIGSKVSEIKKVLPNATLKRAFDAEGIALISVRVKGKELMQVYAGEDDPDSKINLSKKIEFIETFNPSCKTADGMGAGVLTSVAAKKWGGVKHITKSEIESREYIEFKRPPKRWTVRIDYSGIYKAGANTTTQYKKNSKLLAFSVPTSIGEN